MKTLVLIISVGLLTMPALAWAPAGESGGDGLYWNNTGSGSWTDANNWNYEWLDMNVPAIVQDPGWVPSTSDITDINNGGTAVIASGESASAGKFTLGAWTAYVASKPADRGTLEINGGTFTQRGDFFNVGWRGYGTINMNGGYVDSTGWLTLGGAAEKLSDPNVPRGYGEINQSGGTFYNPTG